MELIPRFLNWLETQTFPEHFGMFAVGLFFLVIIWIWGYYVGYKLGWVRGVTRGSDARYDNVMMIRRNAYVILHHPDEKQTLDKIKLDALAKLLFLDEEDLVREMEREIQKEKEEK